MCLIAYQPQNDKAFDRHTIRNGWDANSDGAGYMFADGEKVVIRKPFFKVKQLIKSYERDHKEFGAISPFVIHFRWATHGSAKPHNIHPHPLADGLAGLAHNGVLSTFIPPKEFDLSDTAFFCYTVLAARSTDQLVSKEFGELLGKMIGKYNKFVIMDGGGRVSIVNESSGEWDGSRWYSNNAYKDKTTVCTSSLSLAERSVACWQGEIDADGNEIPAEGGDTAQSLMADDGALFLFDWHYDRLCKRYRPETPEDFRRLEDMAWDMVEEDYAEKQWSDAMAKD